MDPPSGAALVTGSASGIGRAVAERLVASHALVIGVDHAEQEQDTVFRPLRARVEDAGWDGLVDAALEGGPPLRTVVHCAAVNLDAPLLETDAESLRHVLEVNVVGAHNVARHALGSLRRPGVVVLVTSQLSRIPTDRRGAYAASKAAVERMIPDYAREAAPAGHRVVGVAPGPVLTGMNRVRFTDPREVERTLARMAVDRLPVPTELADVVEFVVSDAALLVNGTVVTCDGGYLAFG